MRPPTWVVAVAALGVAAAALWEAGPPTTPAALLAGGGLVVGCLALTWWRRAPTVALLVGPPLVLVSALLGPGPGDVAFVVLIAYAAVLAERYDGPAAWVAGAGLAAYLLAAQLLEGGSVVGLLMLTVPGYVAGTALRLRRRASEELTRRGQELEAERALFAEVSVRNERARIASELHDIVGHAVSAMVVQAAAGQRLAEHSPAAAEESLRAIADSAQQGRAELRRLVDLLTGTPVGAPDLSLVAEIVDRASRTGLHVSCRLEGDREGLDTAAAHAVLRVVQEGLTNALRHAPGAPVEVLVRGDHHGRRVLVQVRNDEPGDRVVTVPGGGHGLRGLRERVLDLGGIFSAGPVAGGGWLVEASLGAGAS